MQAHPISRLSLTPAGRSEQWFQGWLYNDLFNRMRKRRTMADTRFQGDWKTPSGGIQKVYVEAKNWNIAKQMFDATYGKGTVINVSTAPR